MYLSRLSVHTKFYLLWTQEFDRLLDQTSAGNNGNIGKQYSCHVMYSDYIHTSKSFSPCLTASTRLPLHRDIFL